MQPTPSTVLLACPPAAARYLPRIQISVPASRPATKFEALPLAASPAANDASPRCIRWTHCRKVERCSGRVMPAARATTTGRWGVERRGARQGSGRAGRRRGSIGRRRPGSARSARRVASRASRRPEGRTAEPRQAGAVSLASGDRLLEGEGSPWSHRSRPARRQWRVARGQGGAGRRGTATGCRSACRYWQCRCP